MLRKLEGGMLTEKVEEIAKKILFIADLDCPPEADCEQCDDAKAGILAALCDMAAWVYRDAARIAESFDDALDWPTSTAIAKRLSEEANKP
jgi:hypothetical protein